jgi:hypothetical protein
MRRKRKWAALSEKPPPEPMPDLHPKKRMLSVWWDREGPIYWELLDSNVHITMAYYSRQLDCMTERVKRPDKNKIIFQYDNTSEKCRKID